MNEPSNFCEWPCENPDEESAAEMEMRVQLQQPAFPPPAKVKRSSHGVEDTTKNIARQTNGAPKLGLQGRNLTVPSYQISNTFGALSNKTVDTDLVHQGGWVEYDTHNL
jgi:alpha-glucosidase